MQDQLKKTRMLGMTTKTFKAISSDNSNGQARDVQSIQIPAVIVGRTEGSKSVRNLNGVSHHSEMNDRLLTVEEVAERLRVRRGWIYGHVYARTLPFPFIRIGHYLRVRESVLNEYIRKATFNQNETLNSNCEE